MTITRRLAAALLLAVALPGLAACSGGHRGAPEPSPSAVRWWDGGSPIDPSHPAARAAGLSPDVAAYCRMLSATLSRGGSVLGGVGAGDPALGAAATAFVSEVQAVAPGEVRAAWLVYGSALLQVVGAAGRSGAAPAAEVNQAAEQIAEHARRVCRLDLSRPTR